MIIMCVLTKASLIVSLMLLGACVRYAYVVHDTWFAKHLSPVRSSMRLNARQTVCRANRCDNVNDGIAVQNHQYIDQIFNKAGDCNVTKYGCPIVYTLSPIQNSHKLSLLDFSVCVFNLMHLVYFSFSSFSLFQIRSNCTSLLNSRHNGH